MLIDLGQRMIGRCELRYDGCTAKTFNIVKKVLTAKGEGTQWVCQKCLIKKVKEGPTSLSKSKRG